MGQIAEAEKGDVLSPRNLHLRLRVVEFVVLVSLLLNLVTGFMAMHSEKRVTDVQQQTGVR